MTISLEGTGVRESQSSPREGDSSRFDSADSARITYLSSGASLLNDDASSRKIWKNTQVRHMESSSPPLALVGRCQAFRLPRIVARCESGDLGLAAPPRVRSLGNDLAVAVHTQQEP